MAAIRERQHYARWERQQWLKWQTRTICTYVAATVPVEKAGDVNRLLENAQNVGMSEAEIERLAELAEAEKATPKANEVGSFERFMSSFGSPGRWAGAN